jgi:outer membrane protein W
MNEEENSMRALLLLPLMLLIVPASPAFSQITVSLGTVDLHAGKIGLGVDGLTGSPDLLVKYFFNNQLAGQLILGAAIDVPGGTAPAGQTKSNGTMLRGGISILFHLTQDAVSPYVGAEGIFQHEQAGGFFFTTPDPKNTIFGRAVLGAEYFMYQKFSVGLKHSLGAEIRLSRDVPKEETDIRFSTATVFTGRFYFN